MNWVLQGIAVMLVVAIFSSISDSFRLAYRIAPWLENQNDND